MSSAAEEEDAPRKRKKTEDEIDVAPLIDCTFLLLMYFIISNAMKTKGDANAPEAVHGSAMKKETASVITVKMDPDLRKPRIILGDIKGAEANYAEVSRFVSDGLSKQPPRINVIIQADRDVPHGVVQQVMKAAAKSGDIKMAIAVQNKKPK